MEVQHPSPTPRTNRNNNLIEEKECYDSKYLLNEMLSPYSQKPATKPASVNIQTPHKKGITEYILYKNGSVTIDYPSLMADEISAVDTKLIEAAKAKQPVHVGGQYCLCTFAIT